MRAKRAKVRAVAVEKAPKAKERKHFEFFWVRDRWDPVTVELIEEWGFVFAELSHQMFDLKSVDAQRMTTLLNELMDRTAIDLVRQSIEVDVSPREAALWEEFVRDVVNAAGLRRVETLEELARFLVESHRLPQLAELLLEALAFLAPTTAIPARLHHDALQGDPIHSIMALAEFVRDRGRDANARLHALDCLLELAPERVDVAHELERSLRRFGPAWATYALTDMMNGRAARNEDAERFELH